MTRRVRRSLISLANETVPILLACQLVGMAVTDDLIHRRSLKVPCPFGDIYHSDGGVDPAFRIYPDANSAWCFAGCGYFTPVWLVAQASGRPPKTVAGDLLDRIGARPRFASRTWAQVTDVTVPPDRTLLAEALKIFCSRITGDWIRRQYDPTVAAILSRCLTVLDRVDTDTDAEQWLSACKTVMSTVLADHAVDAGHISE